MNQRNFAFTLVSPTNNREIITDAFVSVPTKKNEDRQLHKVRAL